MSKIPENWSYLALDEAAQLIRGVSYKKSESSMQDQKGYLPILRANNIQDGRLIFNDLIFVPKEKIKDSQLIKFGDVIIAMSSGSKKLVGKSGIAKFDYEGAFGAFCGLLRPNKNLCMQYVGWFTRSKEYSLKVSSLSKGVNINNLKPSHFKEIQVPLAPLNEQIRIAKKLDSLLTKVQSAQAKLEKIPTLLNRYCQSVLAAATTGKLSNNNNSLELDSKGFPKNWTYKRFKELGELSRGKSKHRPRNDPKLYGGDYPFIQTGAVAQSDGWIKNHNKTYSEFGLSQSRLFPENTLCITIAANIANTAILTYPVCFPDSVVGFIADESICNEIYIKYLIDIFKEDLELLAPATAQKNINLGILNSLDLPVPSLEEQKEIVRRVENLFSLADHVEKQYQKAKTQVDRLTQSILAKAFRGELVPQDPNDEPAEKLLQRIKAEKDKLKKVTKKTTKKKVMKDKKQSLKELDTNVSKPFKLNEAISSLTVIEHSPWPNNENFKKFNSVAHNLIGQVFTIDQFKNMIGFSGDFDELKRLVFFLLKGHDNNNPILELVHWSKAPGEYKFRVIEK